MKENQTVNYYNQWAERYCSETLHVDMSFCRKKFLSYLGTKGKILDAGCGCGRDSRYFLEQGYQVEAFDASEEMCKKAGRWLGQEVKCMEFSKITYLRAFDGVWACASLLHVPKRKLPEVLERLYLALREPVILYASFKKGDSERCFGGRHFSDFMEIQLRDLFEREKLFRVEECFETYDVRPGRETEVWLNVIAKIRR